MLRALPRTVLAFATLACLVATPGSVRADGSERPRDRELAPSLSTPISSLAGDSLWPIALEAEIVRIDTDDDARMRARPVLQRQRTVVPDGHELQLHSNVRTDHGRREFSLAVTAHQHPGDAIELEWSLHVHDADYRAASVSEYLLHRLQLSDALELGEPALKIARADIVSVRRDVHRQRVEIDGELHEIRIFARSLRG
jgi:hypothetical protein